MEDNIKEAEAEGDLALAHLEDSVAKMTGHRNILMKMKNVADIASKIPDSSSSISSLVAQELATLFLKGMEMCGDLVSVATHYESMMIQEKKKARAEAILIRAAEKNIKTAKEREIYADMDEVYLKAEVEAINAHMFLVLIENKRDDLKSAHYYMRKIAEGDPLANNRPPAPTVNGQVITDPIETSFEPSRTPFK